MDKPVDIIKINCKELLVHRTLFALISSIAVHFLLMSGVILLTNLKLTRPLEWIQDTWNVVTCLKMWTCFIIFSTVVFFQGVICSKDYINPVAYASSRFVKFCHIFKLHNLLVGGLHSLLGGVLAWLHLSVEGGRFGSLIRSCHNHHGYCLVEEHYFLLLEGFWIGLYFFVNHNYIGSKNLQFPIIPQSKFSQVKRGIRMILTSTLFDGMWPMLYFCGGYSFFGNHIRNIMLAPFSLSIEQEPLDKISRLLDFNLIFYAYLHSALFVLTIQSMHILFQAYLTEWIAFDVEKVQFNQNFKIILADALSMEDIPIVQQLGYLDLVTIAQKDKERRNILFSLSQPGGHPYNWNNIIVKNLTLLKKFSEGLTSVFNVQKEKDAVIEKSAPKLNIPGGEKPYTYHMRSLIATTPNVEVNNDCQEIKQQAENFIVQYLKSLKTNFINYLLSKRLISYVFGEQFENKLRHVLNDAQSVIWSVEAISTLAALSLTEDNYGIVQKDLKEIIENLLKLKQSIDKLQKMNVSIRKPMSDDRFLKQTLTALRSAVRRSLYRIVSHFKDYMDDLALLPTVVEQLQPFLSYRE